MSSRLITSISCRVRFVAAHCVLASGFASVAGISFAGEVADTVVTKLGVVKAYTGMVFVRIDKAKTGVPACHTNGAWSFVMSLTTDHDKNMYAALLAARSTGTPITLGGSNICDVFGQIETLGGVTY